MQLLFVVFVLAASVLSILAEVWESASRRVAPLELGFRNDELAWVGTIDGELHALNTKTGNVLWSTDIGGSTIRSFQAMDSLEEGVVVPGADGSVYVYSQGELKRFPLTIRDFVEQSPMFQVLPNGRKLTIVGSKTDKVFQLDAASGKVLRSFSSGDDGPAKEEPVSQDEQDSGTDDRNDGSRAQGSILFVNRLDYRVRAFDEESGKEVWNFTFGVIDPLSNKFDNLQGGDNQLSDSRAQSLLQKVQSVWKSPVPVSSAAATYDNDAFVVAKSGFPLALKPGDDATALRSATVKRLFLEDGAVQLYVGPAVVADPSSKAVTVFSGTEEDAMESSLDDVCAVALGDHKVVPLAAGGLGSFPNTTRFIHTPMVSPEPTWMHAQVLLPIVFASTILSLVVFVFVQFGSKVRTVITSDAKIRLLGAEGKNSIASDRVSEALVDSLQVVFQNQVDDAKPIADLLQNSPSNGTVGKKVGKLTVFMGKVKGFGGNGTIVVEGRFEGRPVAVKRLQSALYDRANNEIDFLIQSEGHSNVVRYLAKEETADFVYLALELCEMTLDQAIEESLKQRQLVEATRACWITDDMRQFLSELASATNHLHINGIVHCDIKPQNVLVVPRSQKSLQEKTFGSKWMPKLSDMGLSRNIDVDQSSFRVRSQATNHDAKSQAIGGGTVGWRAPELLVRCKEKKSRLSRKVDVFSLGCVFFYIIHEGSHPFGEWLHRESHIVHGNPIELEMLSAAYAESTHLIKEMICLDPSRRPSTAACLSHPLLWNAKSRLDFLCDVSNRLEKVDPISNMLRELESRGRSVFPGTGGWASKLETTLARDVSLSKHRKYDTCSFRDLLRYVRNKRHHFDEDPELSRVLSWEPEAFLQVFCTSFPDLLPQSFDWALKYCGAEPKFVEIFGGHEIMSELAAKLPVTDEDQAASSSCRRKALLRGSREWWVEDWVNDFPDQPPIPPPASYNHKSMLCAHYEKSGGQFCVMGSKCGFAHSLVELRVLPDPNRNGNQDGVGKGMGPKTGAHASSNGSPSGNGRTADKRFKPSSRTSISVQKKPQPPRVVQEHS